MEQTTDWQAVEITYVVEFECDETTDESGQSTFAFTATRGDATSGRIDLIAYEAMERHGVDMATVGLLFITETEFQSVVWRNED